MEALDGSQDVVRVTGLVEKPDLGQAPSDLALIGRYVLTPQIFGVLEKTPPGRGGEIQLTDALSTVIQEGGSVTGVIFTGRRYDTGDRLDYLKAVVQVAARHRELGPDFLAWLHTYLIDESRPPSDAETARTVPVATKVEPTVAAPHVRQRNLNRFINQYVQPDPTGGSGRRNHGYRFWRGRFDSYVDRARGNRSGHRWPASPGSS